MNAKYTRLLANLKRIFKQKEKEYSASDIITSLCAADKRNLTYFSNVECLLTAKTIDVVFFYIGRECKYFDFTILKTFIDGSGCVKAQQLMENYIKEIENVVIIGLNLKLEYDNVKTGDGEGGMKRLEIICDKNELNVKELNLVVETLQRCFKMPRGSIVVKDIVKKCIILICRIPLEVEYYLLQLRITAHELKPLSALKITTLVVDGKVKLNIPMDCSTEVYACTMHIQMYIKLCDTTYIGYNF